MRSNSADQYTPHPGSRLFYELENELERLLQSTDPATIHKASPLSTYDAKRTYLERVFSEDQKSRIQDVMAIVDFPRRGKFVYMPGAVSIHLKQWRAMTLPDPLEEYLPAELDKAFHFVRLAELYMEDYISKALSPDLVHAYLKLPHWCHLSYDEHRTIEVDSQDRVHLNSLSKSERNQLFQAFFHYQLNCLAKPVKPGYWSQGRIPEEQTWCSSPCIRDIDAMQCVHEYFRTLVGALAARFDDDGFKMPGGLVFPDNAQFNAELHMGGQDSDAICILINCLAASGINLIDELLRLDINECKAFFDHLYDEMTVQPPVMAPRSSSLPTIDKYHIPDIPDGGLWAELRFRFHFAQGPEDLEQAYIRMYRQRAWAFFDDKRHFKNKPVFCAFQDFQTRINTKEYTAETRRQYISAMKVGQSRSPKHDDIKHGNAEYYPTLEKVLSWNEVDHVRDVPERVIRDALFQVAEDEIISGYDEAKSVYALREVLDDGFLDGDTDGTNSCEPARFKIRVLPSLESDWKSLRCF